MTKQQFIQQVDQLTSELEVLVKLEELSQERKYLALSLHPPIGSSTIQRYGNRMFINEGRDGKWEEISEAFYDLMVSRYDSRDKKINLDRIK